jgi:effector-binding domain-containing protein
MGYEVITRNVPDQHIVSLRGRTTRDQLSAYVGTAFGQLYQRLGEAGIAPNGEALAIYHAWGPDGIDVEMCVPMDPDGSLAGDFVERILPAATVAQTLHVGSYDGLKDAYEAVDAWIGKHGFAAAGPSRERYIIGPARDMPEADYWTLVETPVERALVPVS